MLKKRSAASRRASLQAQIDKAFWSGHIAAPKWREIIQGDFSRHKEIIKTSFEYMSSPVVIEEMGEKVFIRSWPQIRTKVFPQNDKRSQGRLRLFDAMWGVIVTGDSQYPVSQKVANLSKGRKSLLRAIVHEPLSIYELCKLTKRPYSRIHKEVKLLNELKLVVIKKSKANGRHICRLYSTESINTLLFFGGHFKTFAEFNGTS